MHLHFLGTSAGSPTRYRNVTGLALRFDQHSDWMLFDCGEATQHQLQLVPHTLPRLRRIFISHLHGDHCFGLFGLLSSRSMLGATTPLELFGPRGLEALVRQVLELTCSHFGFEMHFHELPDSGGAVLEESWGRVEALPLSHDVTSFAWLLDEKSSPGEFDVQAAVKLGVPRGPMMGCLKRGEDVQLEDGRVVQASELASEQRAGRRIVIAGDNDDPASLLSRSGPLDLLVHEATHTEEVLRDRKIDFQHSTAARVGRAAQAHALRNLLLTHFSPRFDTNDTPGAMWTMRDVELEARAHYKGALFLARDLQLYRLDRAGVLRDVATATS